MAYADKPFWDTESLVGVIQKTEYTQTRVLKVTKNGEEKVAISDFFCTQKDPGYRFAGKTVCIPIGKTKELQLILGTI